MKSSKSPTAWARSTTRNPAASAIRIPPPAAPPRFLNCAVANAQFRNLGGAAGGGILMALAAGLRVVERAQAVGDLLDFIELDLIRRVRGVVHQAVALVVKAGGRFGKGWSEEKSGNRQHGQSHEELHECLVELVTEMYLDGR